MLDFRNIRVAAMWNIIYRISDKAEIEGVSPPYTQPENLPKLPKCRNKRCDGISCRQREEIHVTDKCPKDQHYQDSVIMVNNNFYRN